MQTAVVFLAIVAVASAGLLSAPLVQVAQPIAVQPVVRTVAVHQPIVRTVAVHQPIVRTVAVHQPIVRTVAVAQPVVRTVVASPVVHHAPIAVAHHGAILG